MSLKNMSPNATSTRDEQDQGLVTPGVSDDVHKMSIVEEAANEQRMEIDEEEGGSKGREEGREKNSGKRTKRTQQSKRKKN